MCDTDVTEHDPSQQIISIQSRIDLLEKTHTCIHEWHEYIYLNKIENKDSVLVSVEFFHITLHVHCTRNNHSISMFCSSAWVWASSNVALSRSHFEYNACAWDCETDISALMAYKSAISQVHVCGEQCLLRRAKNTSSVQGVGNYARAVHMNRDY